MAFGDDKKVKRQDFKNFFKLFAEQVETGIVALDVVLGGGFERGDVIEVSSPSGTGKSTMLLHLMKNMLALGEKCCYLDQERGVKRGILENMGLLDKVSCTVGDPFLLLTPTTYDDLESILLEVLLGKDSNYQHVVIDSITGVLPPKMLNVPIGKVEPGLEARYQSAFLQKYKPAFREKGCTLWLINQMRTKISFENGTTEDSAGGFALKFYPDIRIRLNPGPLLKREELVLGVPKPVIYGNNAHIWAVKNRGERSEIDVTIPILFGRGISNILTFAELLKINGAIAGGAAGYFTITWKDQPPVTVRGQEAVNNWVKENIEDIKSYMKETGKLKLISEIK